MATRYILAIISAVFLAAAFLRSARNGGFSHPQVRTWLLIGLIFAAVSAWLFARP